nr:MAG TPA: SOS-response transcriptional repressor [Myoviridae sp. ctict13]
MRFFSCDTKSSEKMDLSEMFFKEVSTLTGDRIISLLRKKGYTQRRIAQEFGVSHPAIHYVIYGKSKSRRIQERIAEIIGRPMDQVFKAA